jgi:hypothetical protein
LARKSRPKHARQCLLIGEHRTQEQGRQVQCDPHRNAMTQHWEDMSHDYSRTCSSVAAVGGRAPSSTNAGSRREHHRHCNRVVRFLPLQHDDRARLREAVLPSIGPARRHPSSPSATSHPPRPKPPTMPTCRNRLSQRDSNQIASGVTGAVQHVQAHLPMCNGVHAWHSNPCSTGFMTFDLSKGGEADSYRVGNRILRFRMRA